MGVESGKKQFGKAENSQPVTGREVSHCRISKRFPMPGPVQGFGFGEKALHMFLETRGGSWSLRLSLISVGHKSCFKFNKAPSRCR